MLHHSHSCPLLHRSTSLQIHKVFLHVTPCTDRKCLSACNISHFRKQIAPTCGFPLLLGSKAHRQAAQEILLR